MKNSPNFDIIIVGAGVAGTSCALALNQAGYQVLLIDRRKSINDYKKLCTHFIQPFSVPILHDLGLEALLSPEFSFKTKAAFLVPGGTIDPSGGYGRDDISPEAWAYNLERRVMDPWLRRQVMDAGITLKMETALQSVNRTDDGYQVKATYQQKVISFSCRLLIAADGRKSRLANILDADTQQHQNERLAYFCYVKGIPAPAHNRSLFSLRDQEMVFLYPLIEERTLLSVYILKERADQWVAADREFELLIELFEKHIPRINFSQTVIDGPMYGYRKFENQVRATVTKGVPFIGDACVSLDPMSGVGCGFALKAGQLLVQSITKHGINGAEEQQNALAQYQSQHKDFFTPHVGGIIADSRINKNAQAVENTYRTILNDEKLQRSYIDLTGRLITPSRFQRDFIMSSAHQQQKQIQSKKL